MSKERFLSVFENYALRERGCKRKTANDYKKYLICVNDNAMSKMGYPDYLEWLSECSRYDRAMDYVLKITSSIPLTLTNVDDVSSYYCATKLLKQFVHHIFSDGSSWPQLGKDKKNIDYIEYCNEVAIEERVPNLCVDIKNEYIRIVDFAKHIFGDLFEEDVYTFVPVKLNFDKPVQVYDLNKEYIDALSERRKNREDTTEEENDMLKYKTITCHTLAKFYRGVDPSIEIFYRNISADTYNDYLSRVKNCLAHEYMHYLHACYCDKIGDYSTFNFDKISEGIAEFFAMMFTLYRGSSFDVHLAEKKYLTWTKMFDSGWPYADALYMYKVNGTENYYTEQVWDFEKNGCIDKLINVLKDSINFTAALKIFNS